MPIAPLPFLAGAVAWTISEYALHRFVGHGPRRTPPRGLLRFVSPAAFAAEFNREHIAHHADPTYFAPASRKALASAAAIGAFSAAGSLLVGPRRAFSFALGFGAAYVAYEVLHRRVHTHPARGPLGRWRRRHHLHHHHGSPKVNHGVTSPFWDRIFSTEVNPVRVRIPRRLAPVWLLDADGLVRPELSGDYDVVGRKGDHGDPVVGPASA
jgi:hypothetical protein